MTLKEPAAAERWPQRGRRNVFLIRLRKNISIRTRENDEQDVFNLLLNKQSLIVG